MQSPNRRRDTTQRHAPAERVARDRSTNALTNRLHNIDPNLN
jgi:hypothetical protein